MISEAGRMEARDDVSRTLPVILSEAESLIICLGCAQGQPEMFRSAQHDIRSRCENFFCEFFYSRIDNAGSNSKLGIPETLQVENF